MAKSKSTSSKKNIAEDITSKRTYIKQADVPLMSLDDALRVPQAIFDDYAGKPVSPLHLAKALNIDPKGAQLKFLSGAAIAYGLIDGGAQASLITVTELAKRILRPKNETDEKQGKRQAILNPRVFKEFLTNYDGNAFPRQDIGMNVLEGMGVPREKTAEVLKRIESSARSVGAVTEVKGKLYVALNFEESSVNGHYEDLKEESYPNEDSLINKGTNNQYLESKQPLFPRASAVATAIVDDERRRKVFITHGKNRELVEPIKRMLDFGELIPVVSVERQSVSKPVPEKVMDDMRVCGAAIIHVDADKTITDQDGQEHVIVNSNVLIEIGAAMAFYGRRFILLVKEGVKLPSNLQGLYEVRYKDENLDANATMKLLEAIRDIKNNPLPNDVNID